MSTRKPPECPGCGKPETREYSPFCGAGCRDRDLIKWLDEGYRIPGPAVDPNADPDRE